MNLPDHAAGLVVAAVFTFVAALLTVTLVRDRPLSDVEEIVAETVAAESGSPIPVTG